MCWLHLPLGLGLDAVAIAWFCVQSAPKAPGRGRHQRCTFGKSRAEAHCVSDLPLCAIDSWAIPVVNGML